MIKPRRQGERLPDQSGCGWGRVAGRGGRGVDGDLGGGVVQPGPLGEIVHQVPVAPRGVAGLTGRDRIEGAARRPLAGPRVDHPGPDGHASAGLERRLVRLLGLGQPRLPLRDDRRGGVNLPAHCVGDLTPDHPPQLVRVRDRFAPQLRHRVVELPGQLRLVGPCARRLRQRLVEDRPVAVRLLLQVRQDRIELHVLRRQRVDPRQQLTHQRVVRQARGLTPLPPGVEHGGELVADELGVALRFELRSKLLQPGVDPSELRVGLGPIQPGQHRVQPRRGVGGQRRLDLGDGGKHLGVVGAGVEPFHLRQHRFKQRP